MSEKKCERQLLHLKLREIHEYEDNPRKLQNPKFDEIYSSILAVGLEQPLVVTKRPGEQDYILHSGGNTRLRALKKIWRETRDSRFSTIPCIFRPWQGEQEILIGHILENEVRGTTNYLERSESIVRLIENYLCEEAELTLRAMADRLKKDGITVSVTALYHMLECHRYILPALPTTLLQGLTRSDVVRLLAFKSELYRVWEKYSDSEDKTIFDNHWLMALAPQDMGIEAFNMDRLRSGVSNDMAAMLGISPKELNLQLSSAVDVSVKEGEKQKIVTVKSKDSLEIKSLNSQLFDLICYFNDKHTIYELNDLESDKNLLLKPKEMIAITPKGRLLGQVLNNALSQKFNSNGVIRLLLGDEKEKLDDTDAKKLFEVFFLLRQMSWQGGAE